MPETKAKLVQDIHIIDSTFHIKYYKEEAGGYSATVQELAGCVTQGDSRKDLEEMVRDAIGSYMASFDLKFERAETMEEFLDEV